MYKKTIEALYNEFVNNNDEYHFLTDDDSKYKELDNELEEFTKAFKELLEQFVGEKEAFHLIDKHEELCIAIGLKEKHDAFEYGFIQGLSLGTNINKIE